MRVRMLMGMPMIVPGMLSRVVRLVMMVVVVICVMMVTMPVRVVMPMLVSIAVPATLPAVLLVSGAFVCQRHVHAQASNALAHAGRYPQVELVVQPQPGKLGPQVVGLHAKGQQRGKVHVAAHAREAIVEQYLHAGYPSWPRPPLPARNGR